MDELCSGRVTFCALISSTLMIYLDMPHFHADVPASVKTTDCCLVTRQQDEHRK